MRLPLELKILNALFVNSCFPVTVFISIFLLSLTNAHRANKLQFSFNSIILSCAFNFNGLVDEVNVLIEDLFIRSKILFLFSGCILSLTNSSKRLLANCSTAVRFSVFLEYHCSAMICQFQSWMTCMHQASLLMQICFHFDAYCRTEITGDVSRMLLRYLFHEFPSFLWI